MLFSTKKLQLSYLGIVREENPLVGSPRPAQIGVLQVVARPVERPELHVGVAGGGGVPGTPEIFSIYIPIHMVGFNSVPHLSLMALLV